MSKGSLNKRKIVSPTKKDATPSIPGKQVTISRDVSRTKFFKRESVAIGFISEFTEEVRQKSTYDERGVSEYNKPKSRLP